MLSPLFNLFLKFLLLQKCVIQPYGTNLVLSWIMQKKSQSDYTNDVWWSVHAIHLYRPNNFRMSNVYIYTKPISSIIMLYGHTHKTIKSDRARSTHLLVTSAHLKRPFRMTRSRPLSSLYIYPTWKIYFFLPPTYIFWGVPLSSSCTERICTISQEQRGKAS